MATIDSAPHTSESLTLGHKAAAVAEGALALRTNPTIELRQFRDADYTNVLTLFRDGMMLYTEPSHPHYQVWVDYVQNSLATDLADILGFYVQRDGCNFFVAIATTATGEREVIGTIAVERRSAELAELRRVSVKSEYRRFGVGRLLMQHATQWAKREHAYTQLTLSTAATQHLAIRFYESLGYTFYKTTLLCENPHFEITHFRKNIE